MGRIDFTREELKRFSPKMAAFYVDGLLEGKDVLERYGILANGKRFSHFCGQFGAETQGGTKVRESLTYTTVARIRAVWPARARKSTEAELRALLRNPVGLGDWAYGGRLGNRKGTEDGHAYRGGGWLQTTGKANVTHYAKLAGLKVRPDILDDPIATLQFACAAWKDGGCNELADKNDLYGLSAAINTGSAASGITPNGMEHREAWFAKARSVWWDAMPDGAEDEAPAAIAAPAPSSGNALAALDKLPFGKLNQLADEGSRLAGYIRRFFRWWWVLFTGGTIATATATPDRGSSSVVAGFIAEHPFLAVGVAFGAAMLFMYVALWLFRHYFMTAADDGRYRPREG